LPSITQDRAGELVWARANASLTKNQFVAATAREGYITKAEAKAAINGDIPAVFTTAISAVDPVVFQGLTGFAVADADLYWIGVDNIRRDNPILAAVAIAASASETDLDALFGI